MRINALILIVFIVISSALAFTKPFLARDLWKIVANPNSFKPDSFYDDSSVNPGYLVNNWEWKLDKEKFGETISLMKTKDSKGWRIYTGYKLYTLKAISSKLKLLYTLNDKSMNRLISTYLIDFGNYKNVYFTKTLFKDGSFSIEVLNKAYAKFAGESSSFERGGGTHLVEYHQYGFLFYKNKFCALNDSFASASCSN